MKKYLTHTVHQADAAEWLKEQNSLSGYSIITSLPDISEFPGYALQDWQQWFTTTAELVMSKCPGDGMTIFYQTDIKVDGTWVDKGFLVQQAAQKLGHSLLAHKIVCRKPPGVVRFGRPAYSHLLGFSKNARIDVKKPYIDVLPDAGEFLWVRGMGRNACELACKMVQDYTKSHTILDPFCGYGSVLAVAASMDFHTVGVDRSAKCVRRARKVSLKDFAAKMRTGAR